VTLGAAMTPGCGGGNDGDGKARPAPPRELTVFHAAGLTPVIEDVRKDCERELGIRLLTEGSGSQVACRKAADLGRRCDLLMLSDAGLVAELLGGVCSWRLDFAVDEVVLAVGARAPHSAEAETDWPAVLSSPGVRLGRVDEKLGPIGYRTLQVWKLQERLGAAGLHDRLLARCDKVVDDVGRLTPLLRAGEIDYAFAYRSICIAHDVRYVRLDPRVNLGSPDADYSAAEVSYTDTVAGTRRTRTFRGEPAVWTLAIPDRNADAENAGKFVRWLLVEKGDVLDRNGLRPLQPARFHGPAAAFQAFSGLAERSGELKGQP
jgi:molybdate/tungstate transport system substrate-binding protein